MAFEGQFIVFQDSISKSLQVAQIEFVQEGIDNVLVKLYDFSDRDDIMRYFGSISAKHIHAFD